VRRRTFIAGLSLVTTIGGAHAQLAGKVYRIAMLDPSAPVEVMNESTSPDFPLWGPLFKELRRLGYVEGQNLTVERYSGLGHYSPDLARKVVARSPDLIFALPNQIVHDLMVATNTIPIVGLMTFPVQAGLVTDIAHPGGNLTGISAAPGVGLVTKRLELLREMLPNMSRVGVLTTQTFFTSPAFKNLNQLANQLGITVVAPLLEGPVTEAAIRRVVAAISEERGDGLYVQGDPEVFPHMRFVINLAREFRLPDIYPYRYFCEIGGLMAYDFGLSDFGLIAARQIHQILEGTKPGDIPIWEGQKFTLSINLKTAKALGLTVPQTLLSRADEVIE
jgi:putative tryptophan/tyrosine transport system substrate-binding protein